METVADAAGLGRFPLIGFSQGCAVSIAYAVRHPERVSHLVLYGGYAANVAAPESEGFAAMKTLVKQGWGSNNPAFRQLFTSLMMPTASKEQMEAFNELQRLSASPESAVRYLETVARLDVRDLLSQVKAPNSRHACSRRPLGSQPFGPRTSGGNTRGSLRGATGQKSCSAGTRPGPAPVLRGTRRLLEEHNLDAAMRSSPR